MKGAPADFFERQYGDKLLTYRESFPGLRRWLRPWVRHRFDVTTDVVARLCAEPAARRVLDFGCGDGQIVRRLLGAPPPGLADIVGLDISSSRVRELQASLSPPAAGRPRLRFAVGDETALETMERGTFDIVLCIAVFGQVYDVYGLGRRLFDVVRPGGRLVAEFANYAYVRHRLKLLAGFVPTVSPASMELWPEIGWDSCEVHHFSRKTSVRFLEQLGFVVEGVHPTGFLAHVLPIRPGLLATGFVLVGRKPGPLS